MSQRLVRAAHDAESDVVITVFHKGGNNGVEGALARGQSVGFGRIEHEKSSAILQEESHAAHGDTGTEAGEIALAQREDVAIVIDGRQVRGVAAGGHARLGIAVGFLQIDLLRTLFSVILREQALDRHLGETRVSIVAG